MESLVRIAPIQQLLARLSTIWLVLVVLSYLLADGLQALAVGYGGLITLLNVLLMRWHLLRSATRDRADPGANLGSAYRCLVHRWMLTATMLFVGIWLWELPPLSLLVGFALLQSALLLGHLKQA